MKYAHASTDDFRLALKSVAESRKNSRTKAKKQKKPLKIAG
jgi:hypothetical protein